MSVNAYRIKSDNLYTEGVSFDLWHNKKLMKLLDEEIQFYMSLNSYGTGIVDVPIELLEKALSSPRKFDLDEHTISQIKLDIESAKSNKEEVVTYYCC